MLMHVKVNYQPWHNNEITALQHGVTVYYHRNSVFAHGVMIGVLFIALPFLNTNPLRFDKIAERCPFLFEIRLPLVK